MGVETGEFISDFDPTNPLDADPKSSGPAHFHLVKEWLQNTFPNIDGEVEPTQEQLNLLSALTALSVLANATNGAAAPAALTAAADGLVLRRSGNALAFAAIDILGGGFAKAFVSADQTFVSTTMANVTDLQTIITLEADTLYKVEAFFDWIPSVNGGFKMQPVFSQTPQLGRGIVTVDANSGLLSNYPAAIPSVMSSAGAGTAENFTWLNGFFHTHATLTSTLSFQAALNSASGNVALKKGSFVLVYKFGVA